LAGTARNWQVDGPRRSSDEEAIVGAAILGDPEARRSLYESNVRVVFAFCAARVGAQRGEDVTAETFCRAFESLARFKWRGVPVRAWLLRIAHNLIIGQSRRLSSSEILTDQVPESSVDQQGADHAEIVVAATEAVSVMEALATLGERGRSVVELRFLRELSVAETAHVLGMSEQAVRASTYRALRSLRTNLGIGVRLDLC
jgi:RNA polymerase sigma-70 factor (ECF subfamily)